MQKRLHIWGSRPYKALSGVREGLVPVATARRSHYFSALWGAR